METLEPVGRLVLDYEVIISFLNKKLAIAETRDSPYLGWGLTSN